MILCGNPKAQYLAHRDEIDDAVRRVLEGGIYVRGRECEAFEAEFASWSGSRFAVGVGNGTDALRIALSACGIGRGDEVITVSHTAVATVAAIELAGATPVLVDVEPESFTIDPAAVAQAVTPKTRAVIAVHLYGNPADLESLTALCRTKNLRLIEDCAQAHGAVFRGKKVGTFGDLACFSFYPTKNLGAIGDGGMITTSDPELAKQCRLLREYGWHERFLSEIPGGNSRLDELQAAILRVKLPFLDADNAARRAVARAYDAALKPHPARIPQVRAGGESVYHLYVMRAASRDALREFLKERGIGAAIHYPRPVHLQEGYRGRVRILPMKATEAATGEILSLPIYPELSAAEIGTVTQALNDWFRSRA